MRKISLILMSVSIYFLSINQVYGGDIVGKLIVGYQGWFVCAGDNSPRNIWVHWGSSIPSPGKQTFELWPDTREYTNTYQTGYANLGNGQPSKLYSSYDTQVINKHFEWMQNYGIDCAAVQRFGNEFDIAAKKAHKDGLATKVKNACVTYGRKFYIMYDISGWTNFQTLIKTDWTNTIVGSLNLPASDVYAKENGKPVVCIWGIGVSGRPGDATSWLEVVNWFKAQGCYVIVGTAKDWRTQTANVSVYNAADMISPWLVGSFSNTGVDSHYAGRGTDDIAYCKSLGIDYLPVVWPGFAWSNWNGGAVNQIPRNHGDFMWSQFYNLKSKFNNAGLTATAYVAMFDEYDEGTAIAKAAEDASMKPTNQYFLSLDADGTICSSDFYLRLVNDAAKMIKGQISLTTIHPTTHNIAYNDVSNPTFNGNEVTVYPNPAKDFLNVKLPQNSANKLSVVLYDISGKVQFAKILEKQVFKEITFDISELQQGLYLLKITSENQTFTNKVNIVKSN